MGIRDNYKEASNKIKTVYTEVKIKLKREPVYTGTKALWYSVKQLPRERDLADVVARAKLVKFLAENEVNIMAELLVEDLIVMAQEMKRDVEEFTKQVREEMGNEVSKELKEKLKGKIKKLREEINKLGEKVDELEERVDELGEKKEQGLGNTERSAANDQKNLQYYLNGADKLRQESGQKVNRAVSKGMKEVGKFSPKKDERL